jgi:hypothetical protein
LDAGADNGLSSRIPNSTRDRTRWRELKRESRHPLTGGEHDYAALTTEHALTIFLARVSVARYGDPIRAGFHVPQQEPSVGVGRDARRSRRRGCWIERRRDGIRCRPDESDLRSRERLTSSGPHDNAFERGFRVPSGGLAGRSGGRLQKQQGDERRQDHGRPPTLSSPITV